MTLSILYSLEDSSWLDPCLGVLLHHDLTGADRGHAEDEPKPGRELHDWLGIVRPGKLDYCFVSLTYSICVQGGSQYSIFITSKSFGKLMVLRPLRVGVSLSLAILRMTGYEDWGLPPQCLGSSPAKPERGPQIPTLRHSLLWAVFWSHTHSFSQCRAEPGWRWWPSMTRYVLSCFDEC